MHLTTNPIDWYAARAAGVVAYVLLSIVVTLGLTMAGRVRLARWPRFAIEDVHRAGGILVGAFVTLHVVTIAIDAYLPFPPASLLVPGIARYRPLWVAFGIVAAELLVALAFTNHYRERLIPYAIWRRIHYVNFAVWLAATVHGLGSGTDRNAAWLLAVYTAAAAVVAGAIAWRFGRMRPLAVGAALGTAALVVSLAAGPLHVPHRHWNAAAFSGPIQAATDRLADPTLRFNTFMVTGVGGGGQQVWFRADVLIRLPNAVRSSSFQMAYLPSGLRCRGTVTHLDLSDLTAACRFRTGAMRRIDVSWQPGATPELLVGTISVRPVHRRPGAGA
jgi:sulfoxide reductase heme-binding subunit YedZ